MIQDPLPASQPASSRPQRTGVQCSDRTRRSALERAWQWITVLLPLLLALADPAAAATLGSGKREVEVGDGGSDGSGVARTLISHLQNAYQVLFGLQPSPQSTIRALRGGLWKYISPCAVHGNGSIFVTQIATGAVMCAGQDPRGCKWY